MSQFLQISFLILSTSFFSFSQTLDIVSWNLKDFGQSRDDNEIKLIAKELIDADIVAIQEVVAKHPGGAKAVARLADQLNRMGSKWDYAISDPTASPSPHIRERYAYLWKTSKVTLTMGRPKLINALSYDVHREPYVAHFKNKQEEVLTIVNYHACTHKKDFPEREEIAAISQWLLKSNYSNVIWAGDMNLTIDDIAFSNILRNGYQSVLSGERTSLKKSCVNGNYLYSAEDNVLYKLADMDYLGKRIVDFIKDDDCNHVAWKRNSYSDHLGIEIKVGI